MYLGDLEKKRRRKKLSYVNIIFKLLMAACRYPMMDIIHSTLIINDICTNNTQVISSIQPIDLFYEPLLLLTRILNI